MEFFELDFLEAGEEKSGDAITLRYGDQINETVHVVDGGHSGDGEKIIKHISDHYVQSDFIDHVVLTHSDSDHASGLRTVLEECNIGTLWMNTPWAHADELLSRFEYPYTKEGLMRRLKEAYPHVAELEEIATRKGIAIRDVFQGATIGRFIVLAPSKSRYLDLVVDSEKTPTAESETPIINILSAVRTASRYLVLGWGAEHLKGHISGTSNENEMSVVQYAHIADESILLTGDAGVGALEEAYQFAQSIQIPLPGIKRFQAPHHGSRRNLSPEILDRWFGPKLTVQSLVPLFYAIVSANGNDEHHPKKAVLRALVHRGGQVLTTEGKVAFCWSKNSQPRNVWSNAIPVDYPHDMEEA
jgi:beta-lactamase superfamily II metal-dependent hydrolase